MVLKSVGGLFTVQKMKNNIDDIIITEAKSDTLITQTSHTIWCAEP